MNFINAWLETPWIRTLLGLALLILATLLVSMIARRVFARLLSVVSRRTRFSLDDALLKHGVTSHLAHLVAALVFGNAVVLLPGVPDLLDLAIRNIALALVAVFTALAISSALSAVDDVYQANPDNAHRSIKGYVQLLRIVVFAAAAIIVIAALINRSPLTLLAGLGAVSAVLLLVFKDTLMSVVASVQVNSNDMLRVGDWISMPEDNVDGDVVDVALHTIKVVNWDKTISTVPTWHLISRSFRNYRNMYETGRRIRRALNIDLTSVRFHVPEEITRLREFSLLDAYFARKEQELAEWNARLGAAGERAVNQRRLSNLGSFRAYVQAYVLANATINHDLFWAVRQLDPGPTGIPIQIYAYTVDTGFVAHHNAQDDIFDHLIAILPEFGLRLFQQPSGTDVRAAFITSMQDDKHSCT